MNNPIDISNLQILKTGKLPKTGGEYTLVLMSTHEIDQIITLQNTIIDALPEEEKSFLIKKDKAFFEKHFADDNPVLGIVHDGNLIAQSVVVNPTAENPKTGMVDMDFDVKAEKLTILQGVIVDPDYRGNRLMTVMVDAWLDIAKKQKRTNALSEVAVNNPFSWAVFMKEGLHVDSIGTDPSDNTLVYNMHAKVAPLIRKRLKTTFNAKSKKKTVKCPHADFQEQRRLLSEGFSAVSFNPANDTLGFQRIRKVKGHPHQKHNP